MIAAPMLGRTEAYRRIRSLEILVARLEARIERKERLITREIELRRAAERNACQWHALYLKARIDALPERKKT